MPFCDLHAHFLPALDDGARDLDESLAMLKGLEAMGYDEVCATPHQKDGSLMPAREAIDEAYARVRAEMGPAGIALRMHLAAENMWDSVFASRMPDLSFPAYDGGPAFLFEVTPSLMPVGIHDQLFKLRLRGKLPVMAHPERYDEVQRDVRLCERLARNAAMVIDVAALDGAHGAGACKAARAIVERNLAHAAASDIHHPPDLTAVGRGIAWLRKKHGDGAVVALLDDGPRRILRGELPELDS